MIAPSPEPIWYRFLDTPIGQLLLAATEQGLVRVAFDTEPVNAVLTRLEAAFGSAPIEAPDRLALPARQLEEYFAGTRSSFDLPLDWRLARGFRRAALDRLCAIPYGETATYAKIAKEAGSPRASRAVGGACANNPLPLIVPCHRVVPTGGGVGQFGGGSERKRWLLALEGR